MKSLSLVAFVVICLSVLSVDALSCYDCKNCESGFKEKTSECRDSVTEPPDGSGDGAEDEILNYYVNRHKRNIFGNNVQTKEDVFHCYIVNYKDGEKDVTDRGCFKGESGLGDDDPKCKETIDGKEFESCKFCKEDLCNFAHIVKAPTYVFLLALIPLSRLFLTT